MGSGQACLILTAMLIELKCIPGIDGVAGRSRARWSTSPMVRSASSSISGARPIVDSDDHQTREL